jgi:hypothetical protein
MRVIVSRHARERWRKYRGEEFKRTKIHYFLKSALVRGARVKKGRIEVPVGKTGLDAVLAPVPAGWIIITFIDRRGARGRTGSRLFASAQGRDRRPR